MSEVCQWCMFYRDWLTSWIVSWLNASLLRGWLSPTMSCAPATSHVLSSLLMFSEDASMLICWSACCVIIRVKPAHKRLQFKRLRQRCITPSTMTTFRFLTIPPSALYILRAIVAWATCKWLLIKSNKTSMSYKSLLEAVVTKTLHGIAKSSTLMVKVEHIQNALKLKSISLHKLEPRTEANADFFLEFKVDLTNQLTPTKYAQTKQNNANKRIMYMIALHMQIRVRQT